MKILFYDTNALFLDYPNLKNYDSVANNDYRIYISSVTLKELECIKTSFNKDEETKYMARKILNWIYEKEINVILFTPQMLRDILCIYDFEENNDLKIIATAKYVQKELEADDSITFYTNDLGCKGIATAVGLYTVMPESEKNDDYTGYLELKLNEEELADFYSNSYALNINKYNLYTNQYLLLLNDQNEIIDEMMWDGNRYISINYISLETEMFGKIAPIKNDPYQKIALHAMAKQKSQLMMLRGPAGSGKSYLGLGYLIFLLEQGILDNITIFCNTVATKGAAKLGYYKGSKKDKLLDSQIGNFLFSKLGEFVVEDLLATGKLTLLPMSDIRGYDTGGGAVGVYITEAQNFDIDLMKLALQRINENSICILDGDSDTQVDLGMYGGNKNGMRRVSKVFRGQDFYSEVTLKNIYRSRIAKIAEQM